MEDNIRELLLKAQAGDDAAFEEVYQRYYQSVYKKAYQLFKNDADAKDATQEAFLEVHRSLKNVREITSFYAWLMMVVTSKSYSIMRKRKYNQVSIDDQDHCNSFKEERVYMDPIKISQNDTEREILLHIIDSLTAKQAEIVKLIYLKELKLAEIAEELKLPLGTVKTRSVKAKKELKKKLEEFEKRENYRLQFHVDTIIPSAICAISFPEIFASSLKKVFQTFSSQGAAVLSTVSVVALTVSGGTFIYQDYQASKVVEPPLPQNTFKSVVYEEETIRSYREAYYTCMNFANTEDTMKERTQEEFEVLKPIYESMKHTNSVYYRQLKENGWSLLFEKYAYL